jgi:hypothetical protein
MKKVLGTMSKFVAAGFSIAVLALLMSLTYGALQRIFPDSFSNQMWGLVMFDIAAMCWALIFVFQSKSVGQYAASGIGFIVAFLGTLGMVAAEVILSGQDLAQIDTAQIGKWMIYGFIGVTAIHALLVYVHHGTAPEIAEQINVGVARGEIVSEAISQATKTLDEQKAILAQTIHQEIVSQVKRDLNIPILADPRMPFLPAQDQPYLRTERASVAPSLLTRIRSKFKRQPPPSPVTYEQTAEELKLWTLDTWAKWLDMTIQQAYDMVLGLPDGSEGGTYFSLKEAGRIPSDLTASDWKSIYWQLATMPLLHKEEPPTANDAPFQDGQ